VSPPPRIDLELILSCEKTVEGAVVLSVEVVKEGKVQFKGSF